MIRRAKEGEITWLPGLGAGDIPQLPQGISLHLRRGEMGIAADGVIGAIPLLNGDTLQIIPKIGQVNFFRLLFKAEGFQRDLEREYADFVSYSLDEDENIDHVVARKLLLSIVEIMKRSPQLGRVKRRREGMYAIGQIDAVSTVLNLSRRKQEPVVYFVKERTLDIAENRVLSEALIRAWTALEDKDRVELKDFRERWLRRFPRSKDLTADLMTVEQGFASGRYGGPRDYYRQALMLAKIVLGCNGLGLSEDATVEGDAILLNTANVFEKYLRNVIREAYSGSGYVVTKGGIGTTSLYTDGSFELEPDINISKDGRAILIADAKYKQPTSGDHYQMHTYLAVNGIKRGIILAPRYEGNKVVVREYSTSDKTIVREIYLPMGDLNLTEEFLGKIIESSS